MWKINDIDISEVYGVYLKKGAYDALLQYPSVKSYLQEDLRDMDGERVMVQNVRKQPRNVSLSCYLVADSKEDFWAKYDGFLKLLTQEGELEFCIVNHNRTYRFYYLDCSGFSKLTTIEGSGKKYCEFVLSLREPNPDNITAEHTLLSESGAIIETENGEPINANVKV